MAENSFNPLLDEDITLIEDEVTRKICLCALGAAREALGRSEKKPEDFVSNQLDRQLTRIVRGKI
jgi:hypothetical protein